MAFTVPPPRIPPDGTGAGRGRGWRSWAHWYERALGWRTAEGPPVRLLTGLRFDVLELPAGAGAALLRRMGPTGPVALGGGRMWLLVAAGSAEELPGLLDWLQWGAIDLDLTALGADGRMPAPVPPWWSPADVAYGGVRGAGPGAVMAGAAVAGAAVPGAARGPAQGAAMWLRPPEPGREVESTLPVLAPFGRGTGNGGRGGDAPDLVRLVDAAATECHRVRLLHRNTLRTNAQPLAFS